MTLLKKKKIIDPYDENYFEKGEEKGLSCYTNYRWMPTRTLVTASEIIRKAGIQRNDIILDYGAAKGFIVKAFRWLGYEAYGFDTSKYAVENCDPEIKPYMFLNINKKHYKGKFDIILCKDTAEHVPYETIDDFLKDIRHLNKHKAVFIIPLGDGKKYNIPRYEKDITHIIKEPVGWWTRKIEQAGYKIHEVTDNLDKIKPNWNVPDGNIYIEGIIK